MHHPRSRWPHFARRVAAAVAVAALFVPCALQAEDGASGLRAVFSSFNSLGWQWDSLGGGGHTYTLQWSEDPTFSTYAGVDVIIPTHNVPDLSVNTLYYARVRADGGAWSAVASCSTVVYVPVANPVPWTDVGATKGRFHWLHALNPADTEYQAEISKFNDFSVLAGSRTLTGTSALFTGLEPDTEYWGRVRGVNRVGVPGAYIVTMSCRTSADPPPSPVANLDITPGSQEGRLRLDWTAPNDAAAGNLMGQIGLYDIRIASVSAADVGDAQAWWDAATALNIPYAPGSAGALESLEFDAPHHGVTYYAGIVAIDNAGGESELDDRLQSLSQDSAVVVDVPPPPVSDFLVSGVGSNVTLSWTPSAIPDFKEYVFLRGSGLSGPLFAIGTSVTKGQGVFYDSGLADGVYRYAIEVVDEGAPGVSLSCRTAESPITIGAGGGTAPNTPTLLSASAGLSDSAIRWQWSVVEPPAVTAWRFFGDGGDLSGALPMGTVQFDQTGLQPNQPVSGVVWAENSGGSVASSALVRHALGRTPSAVAITQIGHTAIGLSWSANGMVGTPLYDVDWSPDPGFTTHETLSTSARSVSVTGLDPDTVYYLRVRARNGDGVATAYATAVSAKTKRLPGRATRLPLPPSGLRVLSQQVVGADVEYTVAWDAPTLMTDGSPLGAGGGFMLRTQTGPWMPEDAWSETVLPPGTGSAVVTIPAGQSRHVAVRALDAGGKQSDASAVLRVPDQVSMIMADDLQSWVEVPQAAMDRWSSVHPANGGESYGLQLIEEPEQYARDGTVIKNLRLVAVRRSDGRRVEGLTFPESVRLICGYSTSGGSVVQGTPSRLDYFRAIGYTGPGSSVAGVQASGAGGGIGGTVMPATGDLGRKMAIFWFNGVQWLKAAGSHDGSNQAMAYSTTRPGVFQIRRAVSLGQLTLVQVYPRIFTPNGDGANDTAIFQFGETTVAGIPIQGEIFRLDGSKAASMRPGPDPSSTLQWDGKTDGGGALPSGIYVYQIRIGGQVANGTVVIAK